MLPFLDVKVSIINRRFDLSVYRKPTFTGLFLNFDSNAPKMYKIGLVKCMLNRAYDICSNWTNFHVEIQKICNYLLENGYPQRFLDSIVKRFIESKMVRKVREKLEMNNCIIMTLPYFGYESENLKRRLMKLFKEKDLNLVILFKTFKVSNYFRLKDLTPVSLMSNIVYKFNCPVDQDMSYIGMTTRHLITRVKEHKSRKCSAIFEHFKNCTCKENFSDDNFLDSFEIIAKGIKDFGKKSNNHSI